MQDGQFSNDCALLNSQRICTPDGEKAYNDFYNKYGTNYANSATFGGIMRMTAFVNYTYFVDIFISQNKATKYNIFMG